MSVQPQPWPQPTPEIVAAVRSMYRGKRERPLPVMVRDQLGEWLSDDQFAGAYGNRGQPGWPPGRLALVTVFQRAGALTGRQAAEAGRTRIDWKYALGLDLADPGFDDSILSEFRGRVAGGGLDQVVLDTLLERLAARGLGAAGGERPPPSSPPGVPRRGPYPPADGRGGGRGGPGARAVGPGPRGGARPGRALG